MKSIISIKSFIHFINKKHRLYTFIPLYLYTLYLIPLFLISLLACSPKTDKKAQLEKLKTEQSALNDKITALEKELALSDTTRVIKVKNVSVTELGLQSFIHYIEIQGKIDAEQNVIVNAKTMGIVMKINVATGDEVKVGQTLAILDNAVIKQGIEEVNSALSFANNVYQKQKNLWDQKIGTEIQFLTAKNNKESLEKKLATLYEQLDMSNIKSPIDGVVEEVFLKLGQSAAPGIPCFRVVNYSLLKAKAEVAEAYISKVKQGEEVIIHLPDINQDITARISFAGRVINPMSRTFTVEILIKPDAVYHPNMVAILKIADYKVDESIVVPVNIVQNSEEGAYIFIASTENGKTVAKKQIVTVGLIYDGKAEIKKGLNKGDKLISTGYQDLNNGEAIKM